MKPIVAVTWLNSSPPITPATPASAEPRKKRRPDREVQLIPSISAASRSAATRPHLLAEPRPADQLPKADHEGEAQHQDHDLHGVDADGPDLDPRGERHEVRGVIDAELRADRSRAELSRKKEMPIAVISGAIRGASRSGR